MSWLTPDLIDILLSILKAIVILLVVVTCGAFMSFGERRLLGLFQNRYGPNRVGWGGSLQLVADMPSIRCVGYRQMWSYIEGEISHDEMVYRGICATRQLAKRQVTWLRGWDGVHWLDSEKPQQAFNEVLQVVGDIAD
jgi:hypothetical protein